MLQHPSPVRIRIRSASGECFAMGPGKADLLAAIQETGSIAAAGRQMGMSYQKTRHLVDEMNRSFVSPLVEGFKGLLVNYVKSREANVILRGMRAVSDFEFEFQMALMNRKLDRTIETVFIMTDYKWLYISSTIVKEVAKHGGDIRGMVPEHVRERMLERFGPANGGGEGA